MKTLPPCDYTPKPYTGPSAEEVLALRKAYLNAGIFHYYKKPIMIVEGKMQWVWDDTGKRYLDGLGGIREDRIDGAPDELVALLCQELQCALADVAEAQLAAPRHDDRRGCLPEKRAQDVALELQLIGDLVDDGFGHRCSKLPARCSLGDHPGG